MNQECKIILLFQIICLTKYYAHHKKIDMILFISKVFYNILAMVKPIIKAIKTAITTVK